MGVWPQEGACGRVPLLSQGLPESFDAQKATDQSTDTAYRTHAMENGSAESLVGARECGSCHRWCEVDADALLIDTDAFLMDAGALLNEDHRAYG